MRISELADRVGVPVSTVRYYERIGLVPAPERTDAGYRDYDEDSATRLLFVSRARGLGIACEQIAELLPVWRGSDCVSVRDRIVSLIDEKQAEIAARIEELATFAAQLQAVRESFDAVPAPASCQTDLSCCVPPSASAFVPAEAPQTVSSLTLSVTESIIGKPGSLIPQRSEQAAVSLAQLEDADSALRIVDDNDGIAIRVSQ